MNRELLLSLRNLSCGYHDQQVVRGLNLHLNAGDIGCLLGPSGCGKTTTLRAIAGFEPVLEGEIELAVRSTLFRGERLQRFVLADGSQEVRVDAENIVWAGGPASWLVMNNLAGGLELRLQRATVVNITTALFWQAPTRQAGGPPAIRVDAAQSLESPAVKLATATLPGGDAMLGLAQALNSQPPSWKDARSQVPIGSPCA